MKNCTILRLVALYLKIVVKIIIYNQFRIQFGQSNYLGTPCWFTINSYDDSINSLNCRAISYLNIIPFKIQNGQ